MKRKSDMRYIDNSYRYLIDIIILSWLSIVVIACYMLLLATSFTLPAFAIYFIHASGVSIMTAWFLLWDAIIEEIKTEDLGDRNSIEARKWQMYSK